VAWAITSVYENSTAVIQYQYCENINDGRGYTSGRAGFCTGTGDAIEVVECFVEALAATGLSNHDRMAKYVGPLRGLKGADTAPVDRLGSYCSDWTASATDPVTAAAFKHCQDRVVSELYQGPACRSARSWGITSPLFLAELYDAWINQGSGDRLLDDAASRRCGAADRCSTRGDSPLEG
jgi:chitosanase